MANLLICMCQGILETVKPPTVNYLVMIMSYLIMVSHIECEGWKFISSAFADKRPGVIPPLSDKHAGVNAAARSKCFTTPGSIFSYFSDDNVMAAICSRINERADVFSRVGDFFYLKKKIK